MLDNLGSDSSAMSSSLPTRGMVSVISEHQFGTCEGHGDDDDDRQRQQERLVTRAEPGPGASRQLRSFSCFLIPLPPPYVCSHPQANSSVVDVRVGEGVRMGTEIKGQLASTLKFPKELLGERRWPGPT